MADRADRIKDRIIRAAGEIEADVIGWRRHFHRRPELSFEEFDTSDFIAGQLQDMGYEVKRNIGGTGICALLNTQTPGPVIGFRADMDALPILETTGLPFESERAGIMHACGHDAHMAILLGVAKVLSQLKDGLRGTVKILFQPGEEANGGAKCMINDGVLTRPDVSSIFALHMIPELPVGSIGIRSGYLSATDDVFMITIRGRNAHSSEPREGVNAIVIAAHVITALQSIQNCDLDPFDAATMSICTIRSGDAENVIPDHAELKGMIRCVEKETKLKMRERIQAIAANTAVALNGTARVDFIEGFPSLYNDPRLTKTVIRAGREMLDSPKDVVIIPRPHMGSEDFSYYQEKIPGAMFMLGCGVPGEDRGALHTSTLNLHEDALLTGVKVLSQIAAQLLSGDPEG